MTKKIQKCDYVFAFSMIAILAMHLLCIFGPDHFADESFYPTIPLRLINGDSLVGDEWHLTQFSSLFLYLPVRFWLLIKGSTEGIILFLRFFYLIIHTAISVGIYTFFRQHKFWAVGAVLMFYTQVPLRFMSANYHSLLALFLLLFTISLLMIWENANKIWHILAGVFYGCCCICNPFQCIIFPIYTAICIGWKNNNKTKNRTQNKTNNSTQLHANLFFSKDAYLKIFAGVCVTALISVFFYFITGGTIKSLIENLPNLLTDKGHDIFQTPLEAWVKKITLTFNHINSISFNLPFLLPVFYVALLFDKHRKEKNHRTIYICLSFLLSIFFIVGVTIGALNSSRCLAITLPFAIICTTCYILTERKNKMLFYCMWLPSAIATVIQYLASDMHLSVMWALTIGNIAGVFFVKFFVEELKSQKKSSSNTKKQKQLIAFILCVCVCLQFAFQCSLYVIGRVVVPDHLKLEKGPYKGLYMQEQSLNKNMEIMDDLDIIKAQTDADDHILIISEFSWMYLYLERPFATYSAWQPFLEKERLIKYYKMNPEKIPAYIYIGYSTIPSSVLKGHGYNPKRAENYADSIKNFLECSEQTLSNGILLKVEEKNLSY